MFTYTKLLFYHMSKYKRTITFQQLCRMECSIDNDHRTVQTALLDSHRKDKESAHSEAILALASQLCFLYFFCTFH